MFNETKGIWIEVYKGFTILLSISILLGSIALGCAMIKEGGFAGGLLYEAFGLEPRIELLGCIFIFVGVIFAFIVLAANMLILNFLKNVQIIREYSEKSYWYKNAHIS